MRIGMVCSSCKTIKALSCYGDYDSFRPVCIKCESKDDKKTEIFFGPFKFNKKELAIIEKTEKIHDEVIERVEAIKKIKERKNKRSYPAIFTKKARILLNEARGNNGCTACGIRELLQVHHIDKDKFNNEDSNLLVLCFYCHAKEHKHMQNKKPAKWLK